MDPEEFEIASHDDSDIEYELGGTDIVQPTPQKKRMHSKSPAYEETDGSHKIRRPIGQAFRHMYDDGRNLTHIVVKVYETNTTPHYRIRDAVTGSYWQKYKVGSSSENLFFKVIWSVGLNGRKDPLVLYFHSPEEFERHMLIEVSEEEKQIWYERRNDELRKDKAYKELDDAALTQLYDGRRITVVK